MLHTLLYLSMSETLCYYLLVFFEGGFCRLFPVVSLEFVENELLLLFSKCQKSLPGCLRTGFSRKESFVDFVPALSRAFENVLLLFLRFGSRPDLWSFLFCEIPLSSPSRSLSLLEPVSLLNPSSSYNKLALLNTIS